jgi:hypothetical protein
VAKARKLVADARVYLNEGRASESVGMLEEAERLHQQAGSAHARRAQIADVYFFMAQAQLRLGRSSAANQSFVKMLNAYPGYAETRAGNVVASVKAGMGRAKVARANARDVLMTVSASDGLARQLRVQAVVVGVVDASGSLHVRLTQDGRIEGEIRRTLESMPPFPGDPVYTEMVRELTVNVGSSGGFAPAPDFSSGSSAGFADPPGFNEAQPDNSSIETVSVAIESNKDDSPGLPESIGKDRIPWWQFWKKEGAPVTGRINVAGRMRPITQEWWFWAATGTVVVGGTTAAVFLLSDGSEEPEAGVLSTSYTLSIEAE